MRSEMRGCICEGVTPADVYAPAVSGACLRERNLRQLRQRVCTTRGLVPYDTLSI